MLTKLKIISVIVLFVVNIFTMYNVRMVSSDTNQLIAAFAAAAFLLLAINLITKYYKP